MAYKRISPQPVVEGGTGAQTLTSHGVLLGNTTSAVTATTAGATGTVLIGTTSSAPSFSATPTVTSISFGGSALGTFTDWTSWTPTLDGSVSGTTTYVLQDGIYSRIGNIVIAQFRISISAATGTVNAIIGGLPFTVNNADGNYDPQGAMRISSTGMVWPTGTTMLNVQGTPGTTTALIIATGNGIGSSAVQMANTSAVLFGTLIYRT